LAEGIGHTFVPHRTRAGDETDTNV